MPRVLATLVYVIKGDEVLLHQRAKDPNKGLWVAPGGKLEPDESPVECAIREMREETGLEIAMPVLRGIMTEVSPRPDYQWIHLHLRRQRMERRAPSGAGHRRIPLGPGPRRLRPRHPVDRPDLLRARDAAGGSAVPFEVHV